MLKESLSLCMHQFVIKTIKSFIKFMSIRYKHLTCYKSYAFLQ